MVLNKLFIVIGAVLGALAVVFGAFGAHKLKTYLVELNRFDTFETGVKYQMYHAIALILIGILYSQHGSKLLMWSGYSMALGVLLFSGSLYLLCFTTWKWLGPITPLGGLFFIIGWVLIVFSELSK